MKRSRESGEAVCSPPLDWSFEREVEEFVRQAERRRMGTGEKREEEEEEEAATQLPEEAVRKREEEEEEEVAAELLETYALLEQEALERRREEQDAHFDVALLDAYMLLEKDALASAGPPPPPPPPENIVDDNDYEFLAALEEAEQQKPQPVEQFEPPAPPAVHGDGWSIRDWGLPNSICSKLEAKGVHRLYEWQRQCLQIPGVAVGRRNLVYSAPTSGGKTMVAEILLLRRVLEGRDRGIKGLFVVPTAALAEEKAKSFAKLVSDEGLAVEPYFRNFGSGFLNDDPNGGCDIAVCTIEKAYHLLNRVADKGSRGMRYIGAVVIDEAHLIGDAERGSLLETIVTKIRYFEQSCQFVCMSATLPNLQVFRGWLGAEVFETTFRPVPLKEFVIRSESKKMSKAYRLERGLAGSSQLNETPEHDVLKFSLHGQNLDEGLKASWEICAKALARDQSTIMFAKSRRECELLALQVIRCIQSDPTLAGVVSGQVIDPSEHRIRVEARRLALARISKSMSGPNQVLLQTIPLGVAFHHAGLTMDEKREVEECFQRGWIRIIVATSTLAIGINTPASVVLFNSLRMGLRQLSHAEYLQMAGRAGRAGQDALGLSYVVTTRRQDEEDVINVMRGTPLPLKSAILDGNPANLPRIVLDAVGRGITPTLTHLREYMMQRTLLGSMAVGSPETLRQLSDRIDQVLDRLQKEGYFSISEKGVFQLHPLAVAVSFTWMSPAEARQLIQIIDTAMTRGLVMKGTSLHYVYLMIPLDEGQLVSQNNAKLRSLFLFFKGANEAERNVLLRVLGPAEADLQWAQVRFQQGKLDPMERLRFERLFLAKCVCEMLDERELYDVAEKYGLEMTFIQKLLERCSGLGSQIQGFLELLGVEYRGLAAAIAEFLPRLEQGVQPELLSLMKVSKMSRIRARALFHAGIKLADDLACADPEVVYQILVKCDAWKLPRRRGTDVALSEAIEKRMAAKMVRRAAEHVILRDGGALDRGHEVDARKERREKREERTNRADKTHVRLIVHATDNHDLQLQKK